MGSTYYTLALRGEGQRKNTNNKKKDGVRRHLCVLT